MIARLRAGTAVHGWLLKANPRRWDILGHLRARRRIDSWPLVPSYRVELMGPGHPCVLWVTGGGPWVSGVWAVGEVTAAPVPDPAAGRLRVALRLEALPRPVPRADLAGDPRFATAEVLRQPRMGNPLVLGAGELDALEDLLP